MSFRFFSPAKIDALKAAGLKGQDFPAKVGDPNACCWPYECYTGALLDHPAGVAFDPPAGVSNSAHKHVISAALKR